MTSRAQPWAQNLHQDLINIGIGFEIRLGEFLTLEARSMRTLEAEDRWWLCGVALAALAFSAWMNLSPIHRYHNGDSVIPVLASLERWTPFFWEQNRFGLLLPLLALPLENPFHNLLFQGWLRSLAMVTAFFLLARSVIPGPYWPAAGSTALMLFLLAKSLAHHGYLLAHPYFQALALGLGGSLLMESRSRFRGAGAVLIVLAFWVTPGTLFWLLPLLVLRWGLGLAPGTPINLRSNRSAAVLLALGGGFVLSIAAAGLYGFFAFGGTDFGPVPVREWPRGWIGLAQGAARYLSVRWVAALGLLLAVAAALGAANRRRGKLALSAGLCLVGAAAGELASLSASGWIHRQFLDVRFFTTGLIALVVAGPALLFILLLENRPAGASRAANALALAGLVPVAFFTFGPPSARVARQSLDEGLGHHSAEVLASGSTHVIGNFWRVWPAVYHANLLLFERGEEHRVWGVTYRSAPTRDLWEPSDWREARFAGLGADSEIESCRAQYGVPPLFRKADLGRVEIYSTIPPAVPATRTAARPPSAPPRQVPERLPPGLRAIRRCRLLDTLTEEPLVSGGAARRIEVTGSPCGVPAGARAAAVYVRAILPPSPGSLVVFPADRPSPRHPTISFDGGRSVGTFQILPLSRERKGALAVAAVLEDGGGLRLQVDVHGYLAPLPDLRQPELNHRLHVPGLREEVEQDDALGGVDLQEPPQVAGQGRGVAGDIGEPPGAALEQGLEDRPREAGPRRVDDHAVGVGRELRGPGLHGPGDDLDVADAVAPQVGAGVAGRDAVPFHRRHAAVPAGERQGEQAHPGVEIERRLPLPRADHGLDQPRQQASVPLEEAAGIVEVGELAHPQGHLALGEAGDDRGDREVCGRSGIRSRGRSPRGEVDALRDRLARDAQVARQLGEQRFELGDEDRAAGDLHQLVRPPGVVADADAAGGLLDLGMDLGAQPVAPGLAGDDLRIRGQGEAAEALQGLSHGLGLQAGLRLVAQVLEVAQAGGGELGVGVGPAVRPGLEDLQDLGPAVVRPALDDPHPQPVARCRAGDEDRHALPAGQPFPTGDELLDPKLQLLDPGEAQPRRWDRRRSRSRRWNWRTRGRVGAAVRLPAILPPRPRAAGRAAGTGRGARAAIAAPGAPVVLAGGATVAAGPVPAAPTPAASTPTAARWPASRPPHPVRPSTRRWIRGARSGRRRSTASRRASSL